MSVSTIPTPFTAQEAELAVLREVIELHASFTREAGTTGEYRSAQLLRARLEEAGAEHSRIEAAEFHRGWPSALAILLALPALAGLLAPHRGRRALGALSAASGVLVADDIANRTRLWRRLLRRRRRTTNVVAELGRGDAPVTLVVLAHHDAAHTGAMFDQTLQRALYRHFPDLVRSAKSSIPYWWPTVAAPIVVGAALVTGHRRLARAAGALCSAGIGILTDIARSPIVPGANDNLSGVGVLVALAERWRRAPIDGIRILLVSAGAEEELQGGIYGFLRDHAAELDPRSTYCLTVDTVGSPQLVLLEGEGTVAMHDYDEGFRDTVASVAAEAGVDLERGLRSRFSTDAIVPSRVGIPTVSLVSLEPWRAPGNYHLMTDTPDHLTYETIAATTELAEALARRLARPGAVRHSAATGDSE